MWNRPMRRSVFYLLATALVAVAAVGILTGSAAAPTTKGLALQTAVDPARALAGNRDEAHVFVAVYNEAGPVHGVAAGGFSVAIVAAPESASPVRKVGVIEPVAGVYRISLAPELSSHRWTRGLYVISISVTSPSGSGVVLAELEIGG